MSDHQFEFYVPHDRGSGEIGAYIPKGTEEQVAARLAASVPGKGGFSFRHGSPSIALIPRSSPGLDAFLREMSKLREHGQAQPRDDDEATE